MTAATPRCLGCAMATGAHRCAGPAELLPYGGHCGCPEPACGPNPTSRQQRSVGKSPRTA